MFVGPLNLTCSGSIDPDGDAISYEMYGDSEVTPPTTLLQNTTMTTYTWDLNITNSSIFFFGCYATDGKNGRSAFTGDYLIDVARFWNCTDEDMSTANVTMNFTLFDELTGENLTGDFKYTFNLWGTNPEIVTPYSVYEQNLSSGTYGGPRFCISALNQSVNLDMDLEYSSSGYDIRTYYYKNLTINDLIEISLYLLGVSYSNGITFHVTDEIDQPYVNVLVKALKYDVATGNYIQVAVGKTNDEGNTYIYLRKFDTTYKFIIQQGSSEIYGTAPTLIMGDDVYIRIGSSQFSDTMSTFANLVYDLSCDNSTNICSITYTDTTNKITDGCLKVVRNYNGATDYICDKCVSSISATISCETSGEEGEYIASFYIKASPDTLIDTTSYTIFNDIATIIGLDGVLLAFLLIGTIAFVGIFNPAVALVLSVVGLILAVSMHLLMLSGIALGGIVVAVVFLIWKLKT
jgi:hypothetical protein